VENEVILPARGHIGIPQIRAPDEREEKVFYLIGLRQGKKEGEKKVTSVSIRSLQAAM